MVFDLYFIRQAMGDNVKKAINIDVFSVADIFTESIGW